MIYKEVRCRDLAGPFSHHLYIGFSPANKRAVLDLCTKLQNNGVICYLRSTNEGVKESIRDGVKTSQRCLLFLTSDYINDAGYEGEMLAVVKKSECFSRDMVIILKSADLEVIPEGLREFSTHLFKPEMLNDDTFMVPFMDMITREPKVDLSAGSRRIAGYESARNYFYGYLRLLLPDFKARLVDTLKNDPDDPAFVSKAVHKMLILMPESCFCPPELTLENKIEFTGKFIVRVAHRAGNQKRDYKTSLFKVIDNKEHQVYYFAGEFATPLLTMYDAQECGFGGMTKDQLYEERDGFYFVLKAILSHPDNADCNDQFKLLYWSDPATGKPNQPDIYEFLLPVLRKEISLQNENEKNPSKIAAIDNIHLLPSNRRPLSSFGTVQVHGSNPARAFEMLEYYPMDHFPRGLCLIINIINFDEDHSDLEFRQGAEKDQELVEKLFNDLQFEVKVHRDLDESDLLTLFFETNATDHTNYDAFVCCIMTHGKLGVIYTRDGKPVEILKLVDYFTDKNCPSLKGKPKMFFIQACQGADSEPETDAAGNSLPLEYSTGDHLALPLSQRTDLESLSVVQGIDEDAVAEPAASTLDETSPLPLPRDAVLVPGSPDFLMSYSTLPGSVAYRDIHTGSFYIQALDKCLRKGEEIDRALKMVSSNVREKLRQRGELDRTEERFQLPFHLTSGMDRLIYL